MERSGRRAEEDGEETPRTAAARPAFSEENAIAAVGYGKHVKFGSCSSRRGARRVPGESANARVGPGQRDRLVRAVYLGWPRIMRSPGGREGVRRGEEERRETRAHAAGRASRSRSRASTARPRARATRASSLRRAAPTASSRCGEARPCRPPSCPRARELAPGEEPPDSAPLRAERGVRPRVPRPRAPRRRRRAALAAARGAAAAAATAARGGGGRRRRKAAARRQER